MSPPSSRAHLERRLATSRRVISELRSTNEELLEHVRFLTGALSETQSRADAVKLQLEERDEKYARQLAKRDAERRALEMQLAEVISRVREHERALIGEQPLWAMDAAKEAPGHARSRGGAQRKSISAREMVINTTATVTYPTPRWGIALPAVHAASLPVRPADPPALRAQPSPRRQRKQRQVRLPSPHHRPPANSPTAEAVAARQRPPDPDAEDAEEGVEADELTQEEADEEADGNE